MEAYKIIEERKLTTHGTGAGQFVFKLVPEIAAKMMFARPR